MATEEKPDDRYTNSRELREKLASIASTLEYVASEARLLEHSTWIDEDYKMGWHLFSKARLRVVSAMAKMVDHAWERFKRGDSLGSQEDAETLLDGGTVKMPDAETLRKLEENLPRYG